MPTFGSLFAGVGGFDLDDHTRWDADGNELPDSFRYRACGNGVAAPVAEWIATRLQEAAS